MVALSVLQEGGDELIRSKEDEIGLLQILHGLGFNEESGESLEAFASRALVKLATKLEKAVTS